jgi:RES domain-containing protein
MVNPDVVDLTEEAGADHSMEQNEMPLTDLVHVQTSHSHLYIPSLALDDSEVIDLTIHEGGSDESLDQSDLPNGDLAVLEQQTSHSQYIPQLSDLEMIIDDPEVIDLTIHEGGADEMRCQMETWQCLSRRHLTSLYKSSQPTANCTLLH